MLQKEKVFMILKYVGCFLLSNIFFILIIMFIGYFDERDELSECYLWKDGKIVENPPDYIDVWSYKGAYGEGYCSFIPLFYFIFYILALPFLRFYDIIRCKVIKRKQSFLMAIGEIIAWFLCWSGIKYRWIVDEPERFLYALNKSVYFIAPLTFIMLLFYILPHKVLKLLTVLLAIPYVLWLLSILLLFLSNIWGWEII